MLERQSHFLLQHPVPRLLSDLWIFSVSRVFFQVLLKFCLCELSIQQAKLERSWLRQGWVWNPKLVVPLPALSLLLQGALITFCQELLVCDIYGHGGGQYGGGKGKAYTEILPGPVQGSDPHYSPRCKKSNCKGGALFNPIGRQPVSTQQPKFCQD